MTEIQIEYSPRAQFIPFHQRNQRFACMVCHRRSGKTVACVNDIGAKAIRSRKKDPRFAYVAPFYRQAKDIAWGYVKSFLGPIIKKTYESELRVHLLNDAWITLYGADNPDALRGIYLDGVVLDEFGDCRPRLWGQVILPTLIDRKGWAVFIGTPRGKNEFYRIHQRAMSEETWYYMMLRASESHIIAEEDLLEVKGEMSEEEYEQEMECNFDAANQGTYFAKEIQNAEVEGRITELEFEKDSPIIVGADLGRKDNTALWFFQVRPDGLAFLDYEEHSGHGVEFYIDLFKSKSWDYKDIWLPHDAKAKTFATSRSAIEQLLEAGLPVKLAPKLSKQDSIEAARLVLRRSWFNSANPRVLQGVDALRSYRRRFNELTKTWSNDPLHDWASDGADAFQTLAVISEIGKNRSRSGKEKIITPEDNRFGYTLDGLFQDRDRGTRQFNRLRMR